DIEDLRALFRRAVDAAAVTARRNRLALRDRFGNLALVGTLAAERMADRPIAFMARVLVDAVIRLRRDHLPDRERSRVAYGLVDRGRVLDHIRVDARETIRHPDLVAVPRAVAV